MKPDNYEEASALWDIFLPDPYDNRKTLKKKLEFIVTSEIIGFRKALKDPNVKKIVSSEDIPRFCYVFRCKWSDKFWWVYYPHLNPQKSVKDVEKAYELFQRMEKLGMVHVEPLYGKHTYRESFIREIVSGGKRRLS